MNRKYLIYGLPFLLTLVLVLVFFPRQKSFTIMINGEEQTFETNKTKVEDILSEAAIQIYPEDLVIPDLENRIKDGESIEIERAVTYLITADGKIERIVLIPTSPKDILELLDLAFDPKDLILVNGEAHPYEKIIERNLFSTVEIRRSIELKIQIGNEHQVIQTTAATVGEALWEANIPINHNESLSLPSSNQLTKNTILIISPTQEIEIVIAGKSLTLRSSATTVGEVLAQTGISLQNLDYSLPPEDEPVPEDGVIEVIRVEEAILGEQSLIPFGSYTQAMPDELIDTHTILQIGEYGLKTQRIRVRYENGVEVFREIEDEWVVRDSVPRIEGYGTYIDLKLMDTPHGQINYYRALEFYVTSYYVDYTNPPWYGRVYCNNRLYEPGFVAVDLSYIPCGTKLYVPGYGFATAMDTGQFTGAWLDVGYLVDEYIPWHQYLTVYFLSPPPSPEDISYIIPPGEFY